MAGFNDSTDAELAMLRAKVVPAYNLFVQIQAQVKNFVQTYDNCLSLIQTVKAHGLDKYDNGPPYPLEGALAPVKASDLGNALIAAGALIQFMNTPMDVNQGVGDPDLQKPDTLLRRLTF